MPKLLATIPAKANCGTLYILHEKERNMTESFPKRVVAVLMTHWATAIAVTLSGVASLLWAKHAERLYSWLESLLEAKGMLAILLFFAIGLAYALLLHVQWRRSRAPFFDRLEPVPGAGYCREPRTGEFVCPRCASEDRKAYLAQISDAALFCQSCNHGVKRFLEKEPNK
jgi:hypothetical protein